MFSNSEVELNLQQGDLLEKRLAKNGIIKYIFTKPKAQ